MKKLTLAFMVSPYVLGSYTQFGENPNQERSLLGFTLFDFVLSAPFAIFGDVRRGSGIRFKRDKKGPGDLKLVVRNKDLSL